MIDYEIIRKGHREAISNSNNYRLVNNLKRSNTNILGHRFTLMTRTTLVQVPFH